MYRHENLYAHHLLHCNSNYYSTVSSISLKLVVISSALVVTTSGAFEEEQRVSVDFQSLIVLLKYFQIQKQ